MSVHEHMNRNVYALTRSAIREYSRLAAETPGCVRLTLGEPDFTTPKNICEEAKRSIESGNTHYIENQGAKELREKIAWYERDHNGIHYSFDEVIVTAGATEALFIALTGILNPGDEVIVPQPAFVLYEQIVRLAGAVTVPLDTRESSFQIDKDALQHLVTDRTKAVILNSPNNPTGCVYNSESLKAVYEAVAGRDIFVICDDVYRQLYYGSDYHSFSEFSDIREQIIVVQSFSKPYAMTGWRLGYLMADRTVTERLELIHQFSVVSTPSMFQQAGIAALGTDFSDMLEEYRWRRDYVLSRLGEIGLAATVPEGAFYIFPEIKEFGLDSGSFARRLITEAGVAVTPGLAFGSDEHIRISYCCSREDLEKGLDRLQGFISRLRSQQM